MNTKTMIEYKIQKTQTRGFEQTISTALHLVGFQSEGCEAHNSSKGLLKLYFGVFGSSPAKCPSVTVGQFIVVFYIYLLHLIFVLQWDSISLFCKYFKDSEDSC